jgi:hypothetical protein
MLRRKLAALLAGAMVLTSLPMVSFAKTDNNVDRVPVVSDDFNFKEAFEAGKDVPILTIKADPHALVGQKFRLKFENAEWKVDGLQTVDEKYVDGGVTEYTYRKLTDTSVQIEVFGNPDANNKIQIPMLVEMDGTGDAKVTIDPVDSTVSSGTYVFAIGGEGDTIATIEKAEKITDGDEIKPIEIRETKIGVFESETNQEIELRLPNNFEWIIDDEFEVITTGGLEFKRIIDHDGKDVDYYTTFKNGDRKILVINTKVGSNGESRGSLIISGLKIKGNNKAKLGDVDVKISGEDITSQTLKVAEYVDYGVIVKADGDPKEIFAGRYNDDWNDEEHELQKLIIEEDVVNSWLVERTTTIEFPSWVQILGYKIDKEDKIKTTLQTNEGDDEYNAVAAKDADENEVSFTATEVDSGKKKLEITFYVSVEADASGDITATVSGRALEDAQEVVLGKAIAPVEVEVEVADVRIGRQDQALGNITITEAKAEAIKEGDLEIRLPEGFEWTDTPTVEVTDGDLEIDDKNIKVASDDVTLIIPVKTDSREASTIVISDITVDLDRTIPEGTFKLEIGGDALLQNDGDDDEYGQFRTDYVAKVEFANVVTPNPEDLSSGKASAQKATFTVGSVDYTVGEEVATADVAPYIKDGRTMLPVKYVAYALGIDPSNIKWDQATKTVTILGDRVVQVKIGSKDLVVNGAVLTMDTAAEVKDGRTFLPISWVASALNVPYSWDDATKTVTFN